MINSIKKVGRRNRERTARVKIGREKVADTKPVRTLRRAKDRTGSKNMLRKVGTD